MTGCSVLELRSLRSWSHASLSGSITAETSRPEPTEDFYLSVNYDRLLSMSEEALGEDGWTGPGEGVAGRIGEVLADWKTNGPSEEILSQLTEAEKNSLNAWISLHRITARGETDGGQASRAQLQTVFSEIDSLSSYFGLSRWIRTDNALYYASDLLPLSLSRNSTDPTGRSWLVTVSSPRLVTTLSSWTADRRAAVLILLQDAGGMSTAAAETCLQQAEAYEKAIQNSCSSISSDLCYSLNKLPDAGFPMLSDYLEALGYTSSSTVYFRQEQPRCLAFLGQFYYPSYLPGFRAYLKLHALLTAEPALIGSADDTIDRDYFPLLDPAFSRVYFQGEDMAWLRSLSSSLIGSYKNLITSTGWLSDSTRTEAIRKLEQLQTVEPEGILPDWSGLKIPENSGCLSAFRTAALYTAKAAAAATRQPWAGTYRNKSVTVSAQESEIYLPKENRLNLYALLLRTEAATGCAFSALSAEEKWAVAGTQLAREICRVFDESGAETDSFGTSRDWWAEEEHTAIRTKQADLLSYLTFKLPDGLCEAASEESASALAERFRTELSADISGMQTVLNLTARESTFNYRTFFKAYAAAHFEYYTTEGLAMRLQAAQVPESVRVNTILTQCPVFQETFRTSVGDSMYVPEEAVCRLWGTSDPFRERSFPVFRDQTESTEQVTVRYFSDQPQIACMDVAEYYRRFVLSGTEGLSGLRVSRTGNIFELTADDGSQAVIDIDAGTLSSGDLSAFIEMPFYKQQLSYGRTDPWFPFLRTESVTVSPVRTKNITLSFKDYGIPVYADGEAVYLPVATLADLFCDYRCFHVFFNGDAFYTYDELNNIQHTNAKDLVFTYHRPIFASGVRKNDMADFAYRELCFSVDSFYGYPGSAPIEALLKEKGLDRTLREDDPEIHSLLLSLNWDDYQTGLYLLFNYLMDDGGHTRYNDLDPTHGRTLEAACQEDIAPRLLPSYEQSAVLRAREAAPLLSEKYAVYGEAAYTEAGDTAMVTINSFTVDSEGWIRYYAGEGPLPVETDTLALVADSLRWAQQNPDIKQFVIDLTHNGGGEERALLAIFSLLTNRSCLTEYDRLKGQLIRTEYTVDRNFDGIFDERDDAVHYDFRFAVLTSRLSFSCSNLLASFCRENGILLLGQTSGGGSCSCRFAQTADGLAIRFSSVQRFLTSQGESIETGVPTDLPLARTGANGQEYYDGCLDLARIGDLIRQYYQTKEAP